LFPVLLWSFEKYQFKSQENINVAFVFNDFIIKSYCSWTWGGRGGCCKEECVWLKDRFCEWVMIHTLIWMQHAIG